MLGDGQGGLKNFGVVPTDVFPGPIALVDVNEDSNLDVLILTFSKLRVAFGDGIGNFTEATAIGEIDSGISLVADDFDEDGHLDVVVANSKVATSI